MRLTRCCTARYSRMRSLTFSRPKWSSSSTCSASARFLRHRDRADRRRRAQHAKPPGTDVQDVGREDRQQRDRPAKEHREEIERHRAEEHLLPAQEADARGE